MAKFIALILGICIVHAQCAIYRNSGAQLHRVVRSPHYGFNHFEAGFPPPPPPPPPPFLYHTHNWSGVARGAGGRANGVFSGAAATAESAFPGTNEAVSLAAADTSGGQSANCDDDFGAKVQSSQNLGSSKSTQLSSKSFGSGSGYDAQIGSLGIDSGSAGSQSGHSNSDSSGFASNSAGSGVRGFVSQSRQYSSGASSARQQNNGFGGPASGAGARRTESSAFGGRQGYKESQLSSQNNDNNFGAQGRNADLLNQGGFGTNEQQSTSRGFSSSQAQSSSSGSNDGFGSGFSQGSDFANQRLGSGSSANVPTVSGSQEFLAAGNGGSFGHGYNHHRFGSSNYHGRSQQLQQLQSASDGQSASSGQLASGGQSASGGQLASGSQSASGGQSAAFSGSTNEHQEGLISGGTGASTREEAQSTLNGALELASQGLQASDKAGCSTCQKSSFALSNAKSWNGNAVSLAIGG